jgi:hypothetical protein
MVSAGREDIGRVTVVERCKRHFPVFAPQSTGVF